MPTRILTLAALVFTLVAPAEPGFAQPAAKPDGTLLERAPCPPYAGVSYDTYVANVKAFHAEEVVAARNEGLTMRTPLGIASREEFERGTAASARVECSRIVYMSDGLKVAGLLWRPRDQGATKLPLMIFARGGNRDFGRIPPWHGFHRFAAEGFVVLVSQYRGVDGGEGVEEFGGADVHDLMNLVTVAGSLGNVDLTNVFILGWSRGAMSTFVALKQGLKVNAAAVGGGLLDLVAEAGRRPQLVDRVWSQLMPDFATRRDEHLKSRSVLYWAEQINVPVLIMHGTGDWRASPAESLALAQKFQALGKSYELVMYDNDDHGIGVNLTDRNRRIVEWFRKHMR